MTTAASLAAPYSSTEHLLEARRQVEDLVCDLPGTDVGQLGFEFPWEIRAFALAVAAHRALDFDWSQFQAALIASITSWESQQASVDGTPWSYYEHWVTALESVMVEHGALSPAELDARTNTTLAEPPNRNHHQAHLEPIAVDPARTNEA
jgi:nitrile hydratase accessory protein